MYLMSRQFVWLVPLSNLLLFFVVGLFLAVATKLWPRPAGWLSPRLICAAALMPAFMVAVPQIYPWAWLVLASGIAMRVVPWLERPATQVAAVADTELSRPAGFGRWSSPVSSSAEIGSRRCGKQVVPCPRPILPTCS